MASQDTDSQYKSIPIPVEIFSDAPADRSIQFNFKYYADTLGGIIVNRNNQTPLVIGIYGPWGSGKTTLMKAIKDRLDNRWVDPKAKLPKELSEKLRPCKTVWFQAWKYDKESEILAGLLEAVFQGMETDGFFNQAKAEIEKLAKGLNKKKLLGFVTKLLSGVDVSDFFSELEYKKHLGFYDTFRSFFNDLIWTYLNWRFKVTQAEKPDDAKGALVIFIDDLDRCPGPRIVKVLETVKLFMDHKGCVFVIGADRDIIVKALSNDKNYGDTDAHRFMEKIVQVAFKLPRATEPMFKEFLKDLKVSHPEITESLSLILPAMGSNPRQMKRFANTLNLRHGLMGASGISIPFDSVLLWGVIELAFPQLAEELEDNRNTLFTLQGHLKRMEKELGHERVWEADDQLLDKIKVPHSLLKYIRTESRVRVLSSFDIEKEKFDDLLTCSSTVESDEAVEVSEKQHELKDRMEMDLMKEISAGPFKFREKPDDAQIDTPFWIDIYPVTNERFRKFIENGGYETRDWWSDSGWQWREKQRILRPEYWDDPKWNQHNHPVVGVSWYEADAFCRWLSHTSKDGFSYHLPTEEQWERAARGTDGRIYPWGNEFDKDRCNTRESGIGKTTRVDRYPDGVSPEGCYDMAGNVWEWIADFYDKDEDLYVLKGGSWYDGAVSAACADRFNFSPNSRFDNVGFRCARTLK